MPEELAAFEASLGQVPAALLALDLSARGNCEASATVTARGVPRRIVGSTLVAILRRRVPVAMSADRSAAAVTRLLVPFRGFFSLTALAESWRLVPVSADSHGGAAALARLLVPFGISRGFAALTESRRIAPLSTDSKCRATIFARLVVPLSHSLVPHRIENGV